MLSSCTTVTYSSRVELELDTLLVATSLRTTIWLGVQDLTVSPVRTALTRHGTLLYIPSTMQVHALITIYNNSMVHLFHNEIVKQHM